MGRTHAHLTTRIAQHLHKESSVFRHLDNKPLCKEQCTKVNCFKVSDNANSTLQRAIKEGLHIRWLDPVLNKQKKHEVITLLVCRARLFRIH